MCVGDFGEGGDEGGVDDVLVDYIGNDTEGDYGGYRKHVGMILFAQIQLIICVGGGVKKGKENGEFVSVGSGLVSQPYRYDIGGMIGSVHSLLLPWQANFDTLSIASTSHDEDASSCTSNSSVLSHDDCRSLPRHGYVFKRALGSECHGKRISWLAGHGYRFQSLAHCLRLL